MENPELRPPLPSALGLHLQVIKSTVGPWAQFGNVIGPNGGQPDIQRFAIQQLTGARGGVLCRTTCAGNGWG